MVIVIAAFIGAAFAEPNTNGAVRGVVDRIDTRVALLHAGATASDVERVMGQATTVSKGLAGDTLSLIYAEEPFRPTVMLTGNHVTAIALDILHVDNTLLPRRARLVKP